MSKGHGQGQQPQPSSISQTAQEAKGKAEQQKKEMEQKKADLQVPNDLPAPPEANRPPQLAAAMKKMADGLKPKTADRQTELGHRYTVNAAEENAIEAASNDGQLHKWYVILPEWPAKVVEAFTEAEAIARYMRWGGINGTDKLFHISLATDAQVQEEKEREDLVRRQKMERGLIRDPQVQPQIQHQPQPATVQQPVTV
jgi:hypothetical protein